MQVDIPGDPDAMDTDPDDGDYIPPSPSKAPITITKIEPQERKAAETRSPLEAKAVRAASIMPPPLLSTSTSLHLLPQAGPSNGLTPGGNSVNGREETAEDVEHVSSVSFGLDRMRARPPLQFPGPFLAPE
ncbi:hypothetical protein BOTBODRAFT_168650 [Botryobasidium botryosum FD-172 SS1]|uniref:Uncharacterized protein n=1 Tax=Botryobasidium botryosum (strain FD-172 SS1) TaxID=930990 RepID=A0A067N357_BOTB1|nr:hypothetical protein BOTBODRAFT_168650 [Botryobasidium botryosum FD-172 SS1]